MSFGKIEEFLPAFSQAAPPQLARPEGDERLNHLEATARSLTPWIHEGQQTPQAVFRFQHHIKQHRQRQQTGGKEMGEPRAGDEKHQVEKHDQNQGCPEVGFQQQNAEKRSRNN